MAKDKKDILILVLGLVVVVLLLFLAFTFLVKPALNGLVVRGYNQGQIDFMGGILYQVQQNGFVNLQVENHTLTLIPYIADSQASEFNN